MAPSMTSLFTVLVALLPVSSASSSHSHLHVKHNLLHKRGVNVPAGLPTPWTYKGCYSDSVGSRALGGANYQSGNAMTASACISFCDSKGYVFAGTEYSGECCT